MASTGGKARTDGVAEASFAQMGTTARVVVVDGPPAAVSWARAELERLEGLWSRFRPSSELSGINSAPGPLRVSAETAALVAAAIDAWWTTAGWFDPTVLDAVVAAGYDRPLPEVLARPPDTLRPHSDPDPESIAERWCFVPRRGGRGCGGHMGLVSPGSATGPGRHRQGAGR